MLYLVCWTVELNSFQERFNLEYTDDVAVLNERAQTSQVALNHLAIEVSCYSMCLEILQGWQEPVLVLPNFDDRLDTISVAKYLMSLTAPSGGVE